MTPALTLPTHGLSTVQSLHTTEGTTMSNTPAKTSAPSKAEAVLTALGKCRDPKSSNALGLLAQVGEHIASDAQVKAAAKDVESLSAALTASRANHDGLVTYRNRAIRTALRVGFGVRAISRAYGVSTGTVGIQRNAITVRQALKDGGTANPPSEDAIASAISNPARLGGIDAIVETAKTTGSLPVPEGQASKPPAPVTVKALLNRATGLAEALATVTVTAEDATYLANLRKALETASKRAAALTVPAPKSAPKPSETPAAAAA